MKNRNITWILPLAVLAALGTTVKLAAQEQQEQEAKHHHAVEPENEAPVRSAQIIQALAEVSAAKLCPAAMKRRFRSLLAGAIISSERRKVHRSNVTERVWIGPVRSERNIGEAS